MTRINTNVSSLVAQNRLQASNKDLQTALTRLSTGLRINSGSDDPAGLIASEALRSEITSLNKSISNTRRASQIISTADSALGQVSNLLNDIRGLVVEAANSGALSPDEIAANQLQVDSSLEAINRIAQTTTFQGRKLLDGSLDFITTPGANSTSVRNLQINSASLGRTGQVDVAINVSASATQASLEFGGFTIAPADDPTAGVAVAASGTIDFEVETTPAVQATSGTIALSASNGEFSITAKAGGAYAGTAANDFEVVVAIGAAGTASSIAVDDDTQTITVTLEEGQTLDDIATLLASNEDFDFVAIDSQAVDAADTATAVDMTGGEAAVSSTGSIAVTAAETGEAFNGTIEFVQVAGTTTPSASFADGTLTVTVNDTGNITLESIATAISSLAEFSATASGDLTEFAGDDAALTVTDTELTGGVDGEVFGVAAPAVFELAGSKGSEVFNVSAGTTLDQLVSQINLVSDATGVSATADGTDLVLTSTDYGSKAKVELRVLSQGEGGNFGVGGRELGTDIVATVNGRAARGDGNQLAVNTATLNMVADIETGFAGTTSFTIAGGGANFQLGPEVVTNQQARIGIGSVNAARLGGTAGKMFELGSGESAALATDPTRAAEIVNEAIAQVTSLRGRLGAFQATSLDSNLVSLSDTVANLQEAESSIRDADFAAESAALTRAQILVQSGTNVLSLANQNPQNVLSLLR